MKKILKISLMFVIVMYILNTFINPVLASSDVLTNTGIGEDLNVYNSNPPDSSTLNDKAGVILGVIRVIGTLISVGVLMVLGIKYMMGSVEEKAEYKKTFTLYIIGAFLLFTGTLLPSVIYDIAHNL